MTLLGNSKSTLALSVNVIPICAWQTNFPTESFIAPIADLSALGGFSALLIKKHYCALERSYIDG
jgi:hypothetical protein